METAPWCSIEITYDVCDYTTENYGFQCMVKGKYPEGSDPIDEECVSDFMDRDFWAIMREDDYWNRNGHSEDYEDFYNFIDEYHGFESDKDSCPYYY